MIDQHAINAARAIVSTHETYPPSARPKYATLAILHDGPSKALQVTFGAHQSTDRANSLDAIIQLYRDLTKAAGIPDEETLADELSTYLLLLAENTPQSTKALATDEDFTSLLVRSAADPLMQRAQNEVFDRNYMAPAIAAVEGSGWVEPLSLAVVYDSMIHGGWSRVRDKVTKGLTERGWIASYVAARQHWLATASNPLLHGTVYRMKTFRDLIGAGNWDLVPPFIAHGVKITEDDIDAWG